MKILANDGISSKGIELLQAAGHEVITTKVAQEQLPLYIQNHQIDALLVRSATQIRQSLIEACPSLKILGRGGVGMDNIDVDFAISKGLKVINTPAASSTSVAELVFAHLFSGVRFLHEANRNMPLDGDTRFNQLKKEYGNGMELGGKTLGIIGLGRIGKEVARIGLSLGMQVLAHDIFVEKAAVRVSLFDGQFLEVTLKTVSKETVLMKSDFVSLHVPAQNEVAIGVKELELMKPGAGIINASRGGAIDEVALIKALDDGKLAFAGLDVFENEPNPSVRTLMNPKISLTPHIGAATAEAQDRIGEELAEQIIALSKTF